MVRVKIKVTTVEGAIFRIIRIDLLFKCWQKLGILSLSNVLNYRKINNFREILRLIIMQKPWILQEQFLGV